MTAALIAALADRHLRIDHLAGTQVRYDHSGSKDALDRLAGMLASRPGRFLPVAADLSHVEECDRVVREALSRFDRIDVLVNNAGLSGAYKYVRDLQPGE